MKSLNNLYIFQNNKKINKNGKNNDSMKYLKNIKLNKKFKVKLKADNLYKVII